MQQNKFNAHLSTDAEYFHAWELATYAKAVFTNTEPLRLTDEIIKEEIPNSLTQIYENGLSKIQMEQWEKGFSRGRFLQMSRLHPKMTDDVLEKRLVRIVRHLSLEDAQSQLPTLLNRLATTFLCEGSDESIRVRTRFLEPWQDLILVVPPLLITSAWMALQLKWSNHRPELHHNEIGLTRRLQRWICDSTLPIDDDPYLDYLCHTQGLDETHMHLNGATEAEKVWCDALARPKSVLGGLTYKTLDREFGLHIAIGNGVARLLQQEDPGLTPQTLMKRVEDAVELKALLLRFALADHKIQNIQNNETDPLNLLKTLRTKCLPQSELRLGPVVSEAWQLIILMTAFNNNFMQKHLGCVFWHYALIRAQFCRLLVQQAQNKGFDQFQYITLNELRESTEQDYAERFRQLERGHQKTVDFLEGRFAPKNHPGKTAALIGRILRGYLQFLEEDENGAELDNSISFKPQSLTELIERVYQLENGHTNTPKSMRRLRLGLVPHFIKQALPNERKAFYSDCDTRPLCRDAKLRRDTDQNARALVALLDMTRGLNKLIRGIDAASNERHAGPEVFAPVFRRMRSAGIRRFTYHVGEDFAHLASGLRAIGEAILYLDLDAGCRIGHGTAAGINPKIWWNSVHDYVVLPLEERLDDLVFAWDTLRHARVHLESIPLIESEIRDIAMKIWQNPAISPETLAMAWKLRSLDPLAINTTNNDVDPNLRKEAQLHAEARIHNYAAYIHFLKRHGIGAEPKEILKYQEEIVIYRNSDVLRPKLLRTLQQIILKRLDECTIAIETLPSSNVRISIHNGYDDHHALNWLGLGNHPMQSSVSVVIGSDNPGIFATGLRQEYAHILRILRSRAHSLEKDFDAKNLIERICTDAKRFRF
ncbi:adenosine deaminase [Pseudomonas viridiflava]|uniref:adenosine deaminase n=1 Tax=Pseudomonas viridiflava TaxID=33069 RepID=UPI000F02ADEB|nr:adenosine deaminase [Pseudomonas viridiflava]